MRPFRILRRHQRLRHHPAPGDLRLAPGPVHSRGEPVRGQAGRKPRTKYETDGFDTASPGQGPPQARPIRELGSRPEDVAKGAWPRAPSRTIPMPSVGYTACSPSSGARAATGTRPRPTSIIFRCSGRVSSPRPKFVHAVRDGRDVALAHTDGTKIEQVAVSWKRRVSAQDGRPEKRSGRIATSSQGSRS